MNSDNVCCLSAGQFHGDIVRSREIGGFLLTEDVYRPNLRIPRHSHELAYLSFVVDGSYTEHSKSKTRECTLGTAIFHPASETHSDSFQRAGGHIFSIELTPVWTQRLRNENCDIATPRIFNRGAVTFTVAHLLREFRSPDPFSALAIQGLVLQLLAQLGRQRHTLLPGSARWMKIVIDVLHAEFDRKLDLPLLAHRAGIHPVHLAREFRRHHRCTVGEYIRQVRTGAACQRLSRSDEPISEIALRTGFFDQSHLTRTLKRLTGYTPAQYREQAHGR
jgi:AraC family transcriptional regulator